VNEARPGREAVNHNLGYGFSTKEGKSEGEVCTSPEVDDVSNPG